MKGKELREMKQEYARFGKAKEEGGEDRFPWRGGSEG